MNEQVNGDEMTRLRQAREDLRAELAKHYKVSIDKISDNFIQGFSEGVHNDILENYLKLENYADFKTYVRETTNAAIQKHCEDLKRCKPTWLGKILKIIGCGG